MLVNPSKIYVNINNKAVILLLMAIYNKNQATVSQNHKIAAGCQTKTTTCFSREHRICKHHPRVLVEYYRPKQAPNLPCG